MNQVSELIAERRQEIAEAVVSRQYDAQPSLWQDRPAAAHQKSIRDVAFHLDYLAEAVALADPTLFIEYVAWAKVLFNGLGFRDDVLPTTLHLLREVLPHVLPSDLAREPVHYIEISLQHLEDAPAVLPGMIGTTAPLSELAQQYLDALLRGERHVASRMIMDAVEQGTPIKAIYQQVFQPVQWEVGRLWQMNQVSVAQEHYCTAATQLIMSQLYPHLFGGERNGRKLVATCIEAELHEIGIRMVADFFEMEGWDTYYLGANIPVDSILTMLQTQAVDVLAISATLPIHTSRVGDLISAVHAAGLTDAPKILVGGYPFNLAPDLWRQVRADGYAHSAEEAVQVATNLVEI